MVLTTPHLIYMGLASLWRIPDRELTVIKELVAQYKVQAQFPQVNIGLLIEAQEVSYPH